MPRENSFSDEGRSLTPDLEDEAAGGAPPISPIHAVSEPHAHTSRFNPTPLSKRTPHDKFRATVRKVMAMHRSTTVLAASRGAGAEPGIDPRRASAGAAYGGIKQECIIEVVDYSSLRKQRFGPMSNAEFVNMMEDPKREPWVKTRWINISGVSWDVIKALAVRYDLHPLALEDVFHTRRGNQSKADYYQKHLFLRLLCHEVVTSPTLSEDWYAERTSTAASLPSLSLSSSSSCTDQDDVKKDLESCGNIKKRRPSHSAKAPANSPRENSQEKHEIEAIVEVLKQCERVNVKVSPLFIFLFRDGTVISVHSAEDLEFTKPIMHRLDQTGTGMRSSADPSLLVQSLLDLLVDKALEVIDSYHEKIAQLEKQVLLRPKISTVRQLHILSGDLILHKRTLEPIETVIYGLRRYDVDRVAALFPPGSKETAVGFMSHRSKIYLADVLDHMDYILTNLDMFAGIGQTLIDYTFNMTSNQMNETMRRLTSITIIVLPLSFLTGYFGMNFEKEWWKFGPSDLLFWEIAIPALAVILPLFLLPDIQRLVEFFKTTYTLKKAAVAYKR